MHREEEQVFAALQGHADAEIEIAFKFQCTTILVSRFWEQIAYLAQIMKLHKSGMQVNAPSSANVCC